MNRILRSLSQVVIAGVFLFAARSAFAQGANTGALTGIVTDASTNQPIAGVTVVAQGPQGEQAELTDDTGRYTITGLVPGQYVVRFYFANVKVERQNVQVFADKKIQVNVPMQTKAAAQETYVIQEKAPTVDVGSTKIGTTITKDFTNNVPVGRNFETVATVAPGAQTDAMGVNFAGATASENNYVIDGINVTSVHMSQAANSALGSALNLDFVQEVEVITGGYNAEYGRATGGVVNVITKSGSNEFHGDAAFYYDPGAARGRAPTISFPGSSISTFEANAGGDYRLDFFADLGGPIIKDRLWFYVGFEPVFIHDTATRVVSALVDKCTQSDPLKQSPMCTGGPDGFQDYDPRTGTYATKELYRSDVVTTQSEFQWTGKLNLLVTPDHTFDVAYYGSPNTVEGRRIIGSDLPIRQLGGAQDAVAHWVSKLFDKKWQIEASLSYHRERSEHELVDPTENNLGAYYDTDPVVAQNGVDPRQGGFGPSLSWFSAYEAGRNPAFKNILETQCDQVSLGSASMPGSVSHTNPDAGMVKVVCPAYGYGIGGPGGWENLTAQRVGGRVAFTNFFRALGHHQVMYGWDPEVNMFTDTRLYPGAGEAIVLNSSASSNKYVEQYGWGYFVDRTAGPTPANIVNHPILRDGNDNPLCGMDHHVCAMGETPVADFSQCDKTEDIPNGADVFCANTQTVNHALFLRDSWNILPNLTLNFGIRWERQAISGVNDYTSAVVGDSPILLNNNWAPRIGVIYDPTNEGKAKLYGSFARFYESIPMDINNRSFGVEGYLRTLYRFRDDAAHPNCRSGMLPPPGTSPTYQDSCALLAPRLFGGEQSLIEPDIGGMYTDEIVVGGEYEIIEDLALGAYYTHRNLGQIIEDGSVDNANTYYITNPGEAVSQSQVQAVKDRATKAGQLATQAMSAGNMIKANEYTAYASELATFADNLPYFGKFDKPTRDYNSITLTARKRFSKNWLAQASYTYARTIGNYPGTYNPYIDQRDPNISQLYDLPDTLTNRNGPLPNDIPHQLKLDGYYTWRLGGDNSLVTGTSFRALSGSPRDVLGWNQIYADSEEFILPAGSYGREDFRTSWDLQLAYVRALPRNMQLQVFFAAYNVLNTQTVVGTGATYTTDYVTPIVDGRPGDLGHLKTVDGAVAKKTATFGQPLGYQAPIFTRFGLRFTF